MAGTHFTPYRPPQAFMGFRRSRHIQPLEAVCVWAAGRPQIASTYQHQQDTHTNKPPKPVLQLERTYFYKKCRDPKRLGCNVRWTKLVQTIWMCDMDLRETVVKMLSVLISPRSNLFLLSVSAIQINHLPSTMLLALWRDREDKG